MPRALDPKSIFRVVLKSDQETPRETQPAFLCKSLSGRKWRKAASMQKALEAARSSDASADAEEIFDQMFDLLRLGVCGWKNMIAPEDIEGVCKEGEQIPYAPANLDLLLDPTEAGELLEALISGQEVSPDDQKNSE